MLSQNLFLHHVYFWLQNPDDQQDHDKLLAGLRSLTGISSIRSYHIGKPAATSRGVIDTTYALSWLLIFDSREEQDQYQKDPVHLQFVEQCQHLWSRVVVYDSVNALL